LKERRGDLPEAWPESGALRQAANGDEYEFRVRLADLDPLEQCVTLESRMALRRAGQLVAEEEHTLKGALYFKHELLMMLAQAGFGTVELQGDYTETEATADHNVLVFIARK
jgi:hypothetical protein